MLADSGVKAIYATEFKRTQETARPLAARLGLTVQTVPARETDALAAKLKSAHSQDVVLVVGHSNTVPAILAALGSPKVTLADTEYDALYILSPSTTTLTLLRF
jgi:phosphohistidine phosphatase SixA